MATKTSALFPIVSALAKAREVAKATSPWLTRGAGAVMQKRYLPLLSRLAEQVSLFSADELKSIAACDEATINDWLAENGFNIKLDPFTDPNDFGTAAIMSVLVNWKTEGELALVYTPDHKEYPGARLVDDVTYTRVDDYPHAICSVACTNGDVVHMCVADDASLDGLDLLEKVQALSYGTACPNDFGGVIFPCVELDQEVDISFFLEMGFAGTSPASGQSGRVTIKDAKQQTKLKMNHKGAKVESAAAFGMSLECCFSGPPDLQINEPFYLWFTRPGVGVPYFAGYIDSSDWKMPSDF